MKIQFKDGCEEGHVRISDMQEQVDCEHCGVLLPFEAVISDGRTWWCLDCNAANDEAISDADAKRIKAKCEEVELRYITKRYKQLTKAK